MLANLAGFDEKERIGVEQMPELERHMLAWLAELDATVREAYAGFDFGRVNSALFNFCTNDLSAFYFDIRKDALYCDPVDAPRRRAARTVIDTIFRAIVTWYAPILCFTMEEAWTSRFGVGTSVHLEDFFGVSGAWADSALLEKWKRIRELRRVVTGALELARADKKIGSSLEAAPVLHCGPQDGALLGADDWREVAITSGFAIAGPDGTGMFQLADIPGVGVTFRKAEGGKCARCWMVLEEVRHHPDSHLCDRCTRAVARLDSLEGAPA
jgi:isoleucyl-tRNA synthetase